MIHGFYTVLYDSRLNGFNSYEIYSLVSWLRFIREWNFLLIIHAPLLTCTYGCKTHCLSICWPPPNFFTLTILNGVAFFFYSQGVESICDRACENALRPAVGARLVFLRKVCVYVCMHVYLFVFPHPREQTF